MLQFSHERTLFSTGYNWTAFGTLAGPLRQPQEKSPSALSNQSSGFAAPGYARIFSGSGVPRLCSFRGVYTPEPELRGSCLQTGGLEIEPEEIILKTQYDAFYQSELEQQLTRAGVEQLVIGGVVTHLCCETTARSAFVRGYEVFFLIDGTATYSEAFHTGTLRNLGHGFAVLTTVKHLLGEGA